VNIRHRDATAAAASTSPAGGADRRSQQRNNEGDNDALHAQARAEFHVCGHSDKVGLRKRVYPVMAVCATLCGCAFRQAWHGVDVYAKSKLADGDYLPTNDVAIHRAIGIAAVSTDPARRRIREPVMHRWPVTTDSPSNPENTSHDDS
jgi:hypothetical protein